MSDWTLDELCVVACAEAFRGDGEILASPIGLIPTLGARLAQATFAPDLVLQDGPFLVVPPSTAATGEEVAAQSIAGRSALIESWLPYGPLFDWICGGRRHVMMGASQIDRFGNQNIACIGDFHRPRSQLVGMRGAASNTIHHTTSYWVPHHSPRTFVARVDVVCGIGYDRARQLGDRSARFHQIRCVVTDKGVFDFETPDRSMRLRSLHPGVSIETVRENTGFDLAMPEQIPQTRAPSPGELELLRTALDPNGLGRAELKT